jgi:hypothetical protein
MDYFFKTQTQKPDIFYLWLATEEFTDHKLPTTLEECISKYGIVLKWIEKNEFCHKRWYVYPEHYEDVVISLDEDSRYVNDLVERAKECKSITNLWIPRTENYHEPYRLGFCGQCIVPPKTFPMEAYSEQYRNDRLLTTPKCDECWINTFLLKNNIKLTADISLLNPFELYFNCCSDDTALFKDFKTNGKSERFLNTVNYMKNKYHFDIDMDKVNSIIKYMNIVSL